MSRFPQSFAAARAAGRTALIPYVPAGYPTLEDSLAVIEALVRAGADAIELGVPFSDPIADGPVIREALHRSLCNGTTLSWTLDLVREARACGIAVPIALMGYCNPFLSFGLERLAAEGAGIIDALIVPDLSLEEAAPWRAILVRHGIDLIGFVAPTTTPERRQAILAASSGFIYAIALRGITGRDLAAEGDAAAAEIAATLRDLRRATSLPVAVGFGIRTAADVRALGSHADGVIVGTALVAAMAAAPGREIEAAERFAADLSHAAGPRPGTVPRSKFVWQPDDVTVLPGR